MTCEANSWAPLNALTGWRANWTRFVRSLRARWLIAQARVDTRQAKGLTNLAGQSIADSYDLKARAQTKLRRAAEIAPWIKYGNSK